MHQPTLGRAVRALVGALLLAAAPQLFADSLRIATVAYANAGKTEHYGLSALMAKDPVFLAALKEKNLTPQWVMAPVASVGTFVNEEFANQRVDFALYGDLPSIILNASGVHTRLLATSGSGNHVYLVVPKDSPAQSLADLKGQRIALHRGRPWEIPFAKLLEQQGLAFSDFKIFNLNPQAGAAAIAANRIDALFTLSDAYLLEDKNVGRIIWSSKTSPLDWKMSAGLFGAEGFIQQQPELTQVVVDAYVRALNWSADEANQDAYLELQSKTGVPVSVIQRELAGTPWASHFNPVLDDSVRQHYQDAIDYALKAKLIRQPVDVERLLDDRFLNHALKTPAVLSLKN